MSAHTPGPWEFTTRPDSAGVSRPVVTSGLDLLCAVSRRDGNEAESHANARLIAAAPDLLAALKAMVEWGPLAESLDVAEFRVDVANARAAIAKAEGQS